MPTVARMADVRPAFVVAMRAVLTVERPAGPGWVFERKLDGIGCLAVKGGGGGTRLYSRKELSLNDRSARLVAALDADAGDGFVLDGEAVAFVGGRDRFGGGEGGELFYYVFDVLVAGGRDVRSLPLEERRVVLEGVLSPQGGDGFYACDAARALRAPRRARARDIPVCTREGHSVRRDVGAARARRTARVQAMDPRQPPAPSLLPRPAHRQARPRRRTRRTPTATASNWLAPARGVAIASSTSAEHGME
jgi:hypothetical protein